MPPLPHKRKGRRPTNWKNTNETGKNCCLKLVNFGGNWEMKKCYPTLGSMKDFLSRSGLLCYSPISTGSKFFRTSFSKFQNFLRHCSMTVIKISLIYHIRPFRGCLKVLRKKLSTAFATNRKYNLQLARCFFSNHFPVESIGIVQLVNVRLRKNPPICYWQPGWLVTIIKHSLPPIAGGFPFFFTYLPENCICLRKSWKKLPVMRRTPIMHWGQPSELWRCLSDKRVMIGGIIFGKSALINFPALR